MQPRMRIIELIKELERQKNIEILFDVFDVIRDDPDHHTLLINGFLFEDVDWRTVFRKNKAEKAYKVAISITNLDEKDSIKSVSYLDCAGFFPVSYEEIAEKLKTLKWKGEINNEYN